MDAELREALAAILAGQSDIAKDASQAVLLSKETAAGLAKLSAYVHGETPPPPPTSDEPPPPPLGEQVADAVRQASSANLDVAALEGRAIAAIAALRTELVAKLSRQDQALGIGAGGLFKWLRTREGRSFAAAMAAFVFALATIVSAARVMVVGPLPASAATKAETVTP